MHPLLSKIVSAFDAGNVVSGDACAAAEGGRSRSTGLLINAIELEARVLYSASPLEFDVQQSEVNADFDFSSVEDATFENGPATLSDFGLSISSEEVSGFELDPDLFADPNEPTPQADLVAQELVFIDANVENWQALLDDISSTTNENVSVVLLDADRDGVQQISESLADYDDLSAIHLISHGNQDQLNLGSTTLSNQNLAAYAGEIASWQGSLAENADLLIYGCDLGASDSGQELLESIGALCDCDVAASDDITGHESLSGDWDLEFSTGQIDHDTVISAAAQSDWVGRLAVYTVTSTADDGAVGTLRWAIDSANSNAGTDNIEFNISGSGVQRIDMTGDRYEITEAVIIDATTQSGYTFDTPMIEIDGTNTTGTEKDIFWITGGGTTVRGFSLINAGDDAIDIEFGDGNTIAGNFIGVSADGLTAAGNRWGVDIKTNGNTIGGVTAADRNIISGNTRDGVILHESGDNGGYFPTTNNVFKGNWIGVDVNGDALGNGDHGIRLMEDAANNVIGGTSAGEANVIANNGMDGVTMVGAGIGNSVRGNQFFSNGGLAIDLENDGVTANDYNTINDGDAGSNGLQNFPDIATVVYDGAQLTITGDVTGRDNVAYEVDFYASSSVDPAGHGEAERYLGSAAVTTDAAGFQSFSVDLDVFVAAGEFVTATATHSDGSTSEFSLSVAATYQPTGELLLSTHGDGPSWTETEVVLFGDAGDSFDVNAGLTNGTFSKLPGFDAPAGIRGMHYVESDVQIGDSPNHFDVQRGDIILTFESNVDVNAGQVNEFEATNEDLVVYRPGSTSDYSSGEYFMLLASGIDAAGSTDLNIHGLALVEVDTTVGGTLLEAGTFLIAHSNPDHEDIGTLNITAAGSGGGAADEIVNFLDGSDLGNTNTKIQGLHLLQQDTSFNGSVLTAGTLLVEVDGSGTYAGVGHEEHDVIAITVSANQQSASTSAATGVLLFDGSDVGLSGGSDAIQGLTVVSSGFLVLDDLIANVDSFDIRENQPVSNFNVLDNDVLEEIEDIPDDPTFLFDANNEDVSDGLWEDAGTNGYDLTINSGVTFVSDPLNAPAQITGAFDLNGAGLFNSTPLQDLPVDPTNSAASFEFWIKPDDGVGQEIILDAGNSSRGTSLKLNDSTLEFRSSVSIPFGDNDSMTVTADLSAMIAAQEYIHIVGVIDFSPDASLELFVNGVSVGTDTSTIIDDWSGTADGVGIGIRRNTVDTVSVGSDPFQGQIAQFNLYESALTDSQVSASYDSAFKLLAVESHDATSAQGIAVSIAADGAVTYDPGTTFDYLQAGETTTDTFSYVATNSDGETDSAQVTVTINGQNDAPVIADQSFPAVENLANGSVVATIAANDVDSGVEGNLTYLATGGTGAAAFSVDAAGQITVKDSSLLDFETNSSLTLEIQVSDGGSPALTDTATITINLSDVNEAPSVALSSELAGLSENANTASNVKVADIVVSDDALGTETLSLSGTDSGDFVVIGNELFLRAGTSLDFESKSSYDVTVEVDDTTIGAGSDDTIDYTLNITDFNEAPTVALANETFSLSENTDTSSNVKVADIVVSDDAIGSETLLLSGTDSGDFVIVGNELFLRAGTSLDFESKTSFDVTVEVDDTSIGVSSEDTVSHTLGVTDFNEAPAVSFANLVNSLSENADTSSDVKIADIVVTDDALGSETLTLSGADAGDFVIVHDELFLRAGTSLDHESKTSFNVTVEVDDTTIGVGSDDSISHSLTISDFNEAPTISLANQTFNLSENTDTSSNVKVADIVVTDDAIGSETLSLSGTDAGDFVIVGNELFLRAGTSLDFESKTSFDVTVEVDDTSIGVSSEDTVSHTLGITDFNEAPAVSLANQVNSLSEDADTSSDIKIADIVVTDDALGSETLTLSGTDAGDFVIVGNELFLRAGTSLDFESKTSFDVTVEVDDTSMGAGPEDTAGFTLAVTGVNETPTVATPIGSIAVDEDAVDSVVDLTNVFGDVDSGSLTYSLVSNDNLALVDAAVSGNLLTLDFLQDEFGFATISVNATDGEFTVTDTFTVDVNSINDAPVIFTNGNLSTTLQNDFDPPGDSVGNLFGSLVTDVDPTSSLSGVVVVSNSANSLSEGDWQYSTDSGVNWHLVGVVNDGLTALALDANALIRFVPVSNFTGNPTSLEVRVLDDTFGGGFTSGLARTIVDSLSNGGTTAISAQTAALATEVASHGIIVTPIDSVTDESGGTASFEVLLLGPPTSSVSIAVASDDLLEGTVSTNTLTFDTGNWNVAQTVVVTGVDDRDIDGDVNYSIVLDAVVSSDAGYDGMEVDDVSMSNLDNDDARVLVSERSVVTNENGRTATFAVKLSSRPTADVTIGVTSDDVTEGVVSTSSLTFNSSNWNVAQTVTITGQPDSALDGDTDFQIVLSPTVSGDPNFNNLDPDDVNVVNLDVVPLVQTATPTDSTSEAETETESESESETSDEETDNTENQDAFSGGDSKVSTSSDGESKPQPDAAEGYAGADAIGQQEEIVDAETGAQGSTFLFSSERATPVEKQAVEQASLTAPAPTYESVLSSVELWNDLDDLKEQMETDMMMPTIVVGSATSAASVFTVGYVTWLIRGGQILVGVMARMPAWMLIDPLPILAALDSVDANVEDDSLASMVDNSNEKVTTESAPQDADPDQFDNSNENPETVSAK